MGGWGCGRLGVVGLAENKAHLAPLELELGRYCWGKFKFGEILKTPLGKHVDKIFERSPKGRVNHN